MNPERYLSLSDLPQVRVLGRTSKRYPVTLFWTGSGIELVFTGSELWIEFFSDYTYFEPWVSVELNGAWISRFMVPRGHQRVCLFRGMTCGISKRVRILKETQAMSPDPQHLLQIIGLYYPDGIVISPEPAKMRLEFVGDSITAGEGTIGALEERDWISLFLSAENNYARLTADLLNAEMRIIAQSGWGVLSGWDNNPTSAIPKCYKKICGTATGSRNLELGAQDDYDFSSWTPDAVIVNLLSNDWIALDSPPWVDAKTNEQFKQYRDDSGNIAKKDRERLVVSVVSFFSLLRTCNPQAIIVWAYGMSENHHAPVLQEAYERYMHQTNDAHAFLLHLPPAQPDELGAREHPGMASHRRCAQIISEFLKDILTRPDET